jgi:hypothetical protein
MALSAKKRNNIIADWKTGAFSKNSLSKKYKVSVATIFRMCAHVPQDNKELLEAATKIEMAKRKENGKPAYEMAAIEREAKKRTQESEIKAAIVDIALKGTLKNVAKSNKDVDRPIGAADRNQHQRVMKTAYDMAKETPEATPQVVINNQNLAQAEATAEANSESAMVRLEKMGLL